MRVSSSALSGPPTLRASSADSANEASSHQKPASMVAFDARQAMAAPVAATASTASAPMTALADARTDVIALPDTRLSTNAVRVTARRPCRGSAADPRSPPPLRWPPARPAAAPPPPSIPPRENAVVPAGGHKEIEANRAPHAELFAPDGSTDDERVGEEQASAGLQDT